ncbi:thioredoxin [Candidatus Micrarchaeota archaeon]|nr:thioredoxin [Candidatus Micrarchaeota archaeon]
MEVNDTNFEKEVIERSKEIPVIVDFWAPWCMPCRILSPILEKLEKEYKDRVVLAALNVDENPVTATLYSIRSIPSVKIFVDGKVKDGFIGALPEPAVRQWLEKNLK